MPATSIKRRVSALGGVTVILGSIALSGPTLAGTLENLERERAMVIESMLSPDLSPVERQAQIEAATPRLLDLERMVLRDDGLRGHNTPTVRRAFQNYDLTFLVHASAEKQLTLVDNWLEALGITTQSLMSASIARR